MASIVCNYSSRIIKVAEHLLIKSDYCFSHTNRDYGLMQQEIILIHHYNDSKAHGGCFMIEQAASTHPLWQTITYRHIPSVHELEVLHCVTNRFIASGARQSLVYRDSHRWLSSQLHSCDGQVNILVVINLLTGNPIVQWS